ncbi:MAG: UvrD-helicase domain-containing protein [Cyclobacteriaceae bacterium]
MHRNQQGKQFAGFHVLSSLLSFVIFLKDFWKARTTTKASTFDMKLLIYDQLNDTSVKKQLKKVISFLEKGDFKSADVRKMSPSPYYRARLDDTNRLLFRFGQYQGETYLFLLEVILNHDYDKSRFLNGAVVDESKLRPLQTTSDVPEADVMPITYVNQDRPQFRLLDKILSFDEHQEEVFTTPPPVIIIGSAGSGKTALTLEKMKALPGSVLYCTLSEFLVENSRNIYYSYQYENSQQEVSFLSFQEYLSTWSVPEGKEINFRAFDRWISRFKQAYKIKDSYKLYEEFKGVLSGAVVDKPYLTQKEYLELGIRQSVYASQERDKIYELFEKYLQFLPENGYYDSNLLAYSYLDKVKPSYDFAVIDEVQDITNVQLSLILKSLYDPSQFILCGDSNQIVHPNSFSWANVKTMFYHQKLKRELTRVLATNYRNTPEVTRLSNQLLRVKNARFGSIDKESTYLIDTVSAKEGTVEFYQDTDKIKKELNQRTAQSARFAVLVMREEDKAEARRYFRTPLLFSVQEAKGLEYENIILYNFISANEREFLSICEGVNSADLQGELTYARAKDKSDKSLEVYKFYINALYVAITRAVKNLYVIEQRTKHPLLALLELTDFRQDVRLKEQQSTQEEWQQEARRLELQGKEEQAEAIRKSILHVESPPWEVITADELPALKAEALNPEQFNKKAKDRLFEYALLYNEWQVFGKLAELKYRPADSMLVQQGGRTFIRKPFSPTSNGKPGKEEQKLMRRLLSEYAQDNPKQLKPKLQKYGPNFRNEYNQTPLMLATMAGAPQLIEILSELGADKTALDNQGRNAFQLALLQSYLHPTYAAKTLYRVYPLLRTGNIKVKIFNRLVKIDEHLMEYFILNYMLALLSEVIAYKSLKDYPGFETADFIRAVEHYPEVIMPQYRRQRPYLSSILSKNEIDRDDRYNKHLFIRIRRGYYLPNPCMEISVGNQWVNIYDAAGVFQGGNAENPRIAQLSKHIGQLRKTLKDPLENRLGQ